MGSQYCLPAQGKIVTAVNATCTVRPSQALNRASCILESLKLVTAALSDLMKKILNQRKTPKELFFKEQFYSIWEFQTVNFSQMPAPQRHAQASALLSLHSFYFLETTFMFTVPTTACFEALRIGILYCTCTVFSGMCHTRGTAKIWLHFHSEVTGCITYSSLI